MDNNTPSYVTTPGPPGAASRPRKRRDWIWIFLLIPVLLVGAIGWAVWKVVRTAFVARSVSRDLPAQLAAARREGLPLTPADLRRRPPLPESENVAPLYREITSLVAKDKADGDVFTEYAKGKRDPATTATVRQLLTKWAAPLRLAEQAAQKPHCDFRRPWEQGPDVILPEFAQMRAVVRALAARAIMENADGRRLDALATVETIARISHHAGEDPILIALLVEIALQAIADRPYREVVFSHMDDPAVQAKARQVLSAFDPPPDIEHAFRGEVVICRVCVDIIRREPSGLSRVLGEAERSRPLRSDLTDAYEVRMISYWRDVFRALRETRSDSLARNRRLDAIGKEVMRHDGEPTYELSGILMPVFAQAQTKVVSALARQRLREGCLALADFHRTHGRFPSAQDVTTSRPQDPFSGNPLVYRSEGQGFVLYSVGDNQRDDGGTDTPPKKGDPAPDIVVRYPVTR